MPRQTQIQKSRSQRSHETAPTYNCDQDQRRQDAAEHIKLVDEDVEITLCSIDEVLAENEVAA